jgi:hypothetical protein
VHPLNVQVVAEAGGCTVFVLGLPIAADGATFEDAVAELVDALREYAADWRERLFDVPNHRDNRALVRMIDASDDEQLSRWLRSGSSCA